MKVTMVFSMPEEQEDYESAIKGWAYRATLQELDDFLRKKFKYEDLESIKIEDVRHEIHELLDSRGLKLYD